MRFLAVVFLLACGIPGICKADAPDVKFSVRSVRVGGQGFRCNVVALDLSRGKLLPHVEIATGGVGRTDAFTAMVHRTHAVAAINGSFFEAYRTEGDKDPGMTLIRNGQVIHKGTLGSVVGFTTHGVLFGRLDLPIRGTVEARNGRVQPWYAYWINRVPTAPDNICLFTPAHGGRARVRDGICVVVNRNVVTRVVQGDTNIPPFGYVIHLRGSQVAEASKFPLGARVGYRVILNADRNAEAWQTVSEAVGAGPRLLTDGQVTVDMAGEGFHDQKILSNHGLRSAIGLTRDGKLLLVTVGGPTVRELASVMKGLGAVQAINMDGGASAGLYANGTTITNPGRLLSNVLTFVRP